MSDRDAKRRSAEDVRSERGGSGWRVRVLVDPRADAAAIARHLERFGCRVVGLRSRGLVLELPNASGRADAEAEARLYLAMWHAQHPSRAPHRPEAA